MIKERLISAFFGIILLFVILLSDKVFISIAIILTTMLIIYELFHAFNLLKFGLPTILCFTIPILPALYFILPGSIITAVVTLYILVLLAYLVFMHRKITYKDVSLMISLSAIVTFLLTYITLVRKLENGNIYVWLIFLGAWISDTCAYFSGCAFGKHKLAPEISPKKTIEGSVGGIIGTALIFLGFGIVINHLFKLSNVSYTLLFILGVLSSVFGTDWRFNSFHYQKRMRNKGFWQNNARAWWCA